MYKLTRCVKKHTVPEPMNRHHAFLMRYSSVMSGSLTQINAPSRGHNLVNNGKYWILHLGFPNYSNKVAFFY